ncbi:MAG: PDZ domain-containing protein [Bacteroidales bacterium]|nr:PDZ domain-containing protein [Bacteroidales bacterium]
MAQLFDWVGRYYVDTVNIGKLAEDAIRKTLKELDPHSVYIPKDEVLAMTEPLRGSFEGIGISFSTLNDTILIISVVPGGPSEKTGIRNGDKIITIDQDTVAGKGIKTMDIHKRLRGKKGSEVIVEILRKGEKGLLTFHIIRDKIPIHSIASYYKVNKDIGYIRLTRFSASSKKEFDDALKILKKEGAKSLILDLTGNGGGYIDVAVQLASNFFDKGQLIVYTEGDKNKRLNYMAASGGSFKKGKLVIMIDENSASASEIVAGAIQDWDRGLIVGRRSFGKGLVQREMFFGDSSMIRLTISRYHTPTGRMIQKPYHTEDSEYDKGVYTRLQTGELTGETTIKIADSLKFKTLVEGRTVYGGGGITPDIFVPVDTAHYNDYYNKLLGKGIFSRFILNYVDKNRLRLEQDYPVFETFNKKFQVSESTLKELQDFAQKEGLERQPEQFAQSKNYLKLWIKGYIARDLWSISELYQVINQEDPIFLKAVDEIQK